MSKFFKVMTYTYLKQVRKKSFLLATIGLPLGLALIMFLAAYIAISSEDTRPVGYIDPTGQLDPARSGQLDGIEVLPFDTEAMALTSLENGEIQGFFLLPDDYPQSVKVDLFFWDEEISGDAWGAFYDFLRLNFTGDLSPQMQELALDGPQLLVEVGQGEREFGTGSELINVLLPLASSFFFFIAVMSSGGYLLQAVTDEKENRTIEILSTSLSPEQLIGGKAIGLLGVALTQILLWFAAIVAIILIGRNAIDFLDVIRAPWDYLLVVGAFLLPTFVLIAGIMTAIGGMVNELSQGQQISGIINMVFMSPWFLVTVIMSDPGSPILQTMSLIPFTAFMAVTMGYSFASIPFWQLALSWSILTGTAIFSVWLSARIFRMGMLRYGQRLHLKDVLRGLRESTNGLEKRAQQGEVI